MEILSVKHESMKPSAADSHKPSVSESDLVGKAQLLDTDMDETDVKPLSPNKPDDSENTPAKDGAQTEEKATGEKKTVQIAFSDNEGKKTEPI